MLNFNNLKLKFKLKFDILEYLLKMLIYLYYISLYSILKLNLSQIKKLNNKY